MAILDNIVSYWKLDGNSNNSLFGLNGTDTAVSYTTGRVGQAASFNGSTSKISVASFTLVPTFSVSLWVYRNATGTLPFIFDLGTSGTGTFRIALDNNIFGSMQVVLFNGITALSGASTNILLNNWYHIVVTSNGTTMKVYVNNSLDRTGSLTHTSATGTLFLGQAFDASETLNGLIDEVGVWSREITLAEISKLYNNGLGSTYPYFDPYVYDVERSSSYSYDSATSLTAWDDSQTTWDSPLIAWDNGMASTFDTENSTSYTYDIEP